MNVIQLLNLMGSLSLSEDNISASENAIFLQYLNLAHLELYAETATFNTDLYIQEHIDKPADISSFSLTYTPFVMGVVAVPSLKKRLKSVSLEEAFQEDPDLNHQGPISGYTLKKNKVILLPYQAEALSVVVWYIPHAKLFLETTPEADIPYPLSYQNILADGALYYVFQEEGGFKNPQKMMDAKQRWVLGKQRLLSYLKGAHSIPLSTFSNL